MLASKQKSRLDRGPNATGTSSSTASLPANIHSDQATVRSGAPSLCQARDRTNEGTQRRAAVTSPQTGWLGSAETDSLTVLEPRSQKSRCWQGHALVEGAWENPSSPLPASDGCQQSLMLLGLWLDPSNRCLHLYVTSSPVCLCLNLPLIR